MKVTFSGYSDDNFCVEGDKQDEWGCYSKAQQVKLSNKGASLPIIISGEYSPPGYDGKWKVKLESELPPGDPDGKNHSDKLTIEGPFDDVWPVRDRAELVEALTDYDWRELDDSKLASVANVIGICI